MIAPRPALIAASRFRSASRLLFLLVCVVQVGRSEELTLRRAIDLALAHSSTVGMASADAQRAYEARHRPAGATAPPLWRLPAPSP